MAVLTAKAISLTGTSGALVAASTGGDATQPGDKVFVHFKNSSTPAIDVTFDSVAPDNYGNDDNVTVTIPATTGDVVIGPLVAQRFINVSGTVTWTYSATPTNITVGAFFI